MITNTYMPTETYARGIMYALTNGFNCHLLMIIVIAIINQLLFLLETSIYLVTVKSDHSVMYLDTLNTHELAKWLHIEMSLTLSECYDLLNGVSERENQIVLIFGNKEDKGEQLELLNVNLNT